MLQFYERRVLTKFAILTLISNISITCWGQGVTLVNYDFNAGSSYATLNPSLAPNITATATSTEAFSTFGGTTTGDAFFSNSIAGNALAMANSSGSDTRSFQFQLAGADLILYSSFKVYLQTQRSTTGAQIITLAYSTDGMTYTLFPTTVSPGNGSFTETILDLSAIIAINAPSNLYFRLLASGASGIGTLRLDNFQVQGKSVASTLAVSNFFRSKSAGDWADPAIWEMSLDNLNWTGTMVVPNSLSNGVTIRSTHVLTLSNSQIFDQVTIEAGATLLRTGGELTIADGIGNDLIISGNFNHKSATTLPSIQGTCLIKSYGTMEVDNGISMLIDLLVGNGSGRIIYEDMATFFYNDNASFATSGQTFFPGVAANVKPVFRLGKLIGLGLGGTIGSVFNGVFEANADITFNGIGTKTFRNGIRGTGIVTQSTTSGLFVINGATAELDGSGINLDASGMQISSPVVTTTSGKSISSAVGTTVKLKATENQQIVGSNYLTFGTNVTLEADNSSGIDLQGNLLVNGMLKMTNGILKTISSTITLGSTAHLTESETARIVGTLTTTRTLSKNMNHDFGGLGLEINAMSINPGSTTVTRVTGPTAERTGQNGSKSIQRYFTISPGTDIGLNATLLFKYFDAEVTGSDLNLILFRTVNNGVNWTNEQGSLNAATNVITRTGISSFAADWTAADANTPLPITLLSFTGQPKARVAQLEWTTASEKNNAGFEVERSADADKFETVGFVPALSSAQTLNHYTFTDDGLGQGQYYRLRQLDTDGQYTRSKIIFVKGELTASLWPNPTINHVHLSLPTKNAAGLKLVSLNGLLMLEVEGSPDQLEEQLNHRIALLPVGLYSLEIRQDGLLHLLRMIKQ